MKRVSLAWQIFIGLILGIAIGGIFHGNDTVAHILQPFGDFFLRLIKMIVIPIVVSSLIVGVAGAGDMKQVGKLGLKALIYFEIVTTIAIVVGLLAGNLFHPGTGVDMGSLAKTSISSYVETTKETQHNGIVDTILSIVPTNLFESLSQGNMLPIIFFSVMFGIGVAAIGEKGKPVLRFFQGVSEAMFYVTNLVMKVAPIGVFGLIGVTVTQFGLKSLIPLSKLVFTVYGTIIFFVVVVLGLIAWLFRVNIFNLFKILKDELILAYSTASSEAVLPRLMEKMEKFGCPKSITTLVIPTGYSFNLDGSTLYQSLAALFIAQMYGIHMSIGAQISLVLVLMVTSKGIAGVPGVSFVVLLATLGTVGIPLEGLAFIAGIDRILDMARTACNVVGNTLATIIVSKWEGKYDKEKAEAYLVEISGGGHDTDAKDHKYVTES
ncbi:MULTISPECIES: cation:dicarboxylate symporter family transporter [Heyndrickxia]|uniref:cation:dicarboxylate symporter family transporter n=1 Tax=Heyndrickxia TaxID=2837504 RepID=UPI0008F84B60|nr:cation:dicarboxylase symporter family transporter [Heyndrickxia coagulans]APB37217.1 glutamate:protein symporter [Heyndrickxia coagulans]QPG53021.1 cation:dicarboxylase symporter family transporter [Heyndrickxia coagulans]WNE61045.1 cation:dicarboxylase symporter family transporter [Heyndrickxia coagulans]